MLYYPITLIFVAPIKCIVIGIPASFEVPNNSQLISLSVCLQMVTRLHMSYMFTYVTYAYME